MFVQLEGLDEVFSFEKFFKKYFENWDPRIPGVRKIHCLVRIEFTQKLTFCEKNAAHFLPPSDAEKLSQVEREFKKSVLTLI